MGRVGGAVAFVLAASIALSGCRKRCPDGSTADDGKCSPGSRTESLVAAPAEEPGYLVIVCTPSCDEITEEGKSLGPTPLLKVPIAPGQHKLALRSGVAKRELNVKIVSGQTTAERVAMDTP